jgi:hypothetical protein
VSFYEQSIDDKLYREPINKMVVEQFHPTFLKIRWKAKERDAGIGSWLE